MKITKKVREAMRRNLSNKDKIEIAKQTGYSVPTVNNLLYGVTNITESNKKVFDLMLSTAKENAERSNEITEKDTETLTLS